MKRRGVAPRAGAGVLGLSASKGIRFAIVGAALLGAVGLFGTSLAGNAVRFYTVDQYLAQKSEIGSRFIQLQGAVVPGTIRYDAVALNLDFEIEKHGQRVALHHHGIKPDVLNDGLEVVADGRMGPDGVFQAKKLTVKCPSRYISTDKNGPGR